jgi:hypothetical protein
MEVLMSFYEDRKDEKEEDVELRKKKQIMCLSQSIRFRTPSCIFMLHFILPDLTCFIQRKRGRDVIL